LHRDISRCGHFDLSAHALGDSFAEHPEFVGAFQKFKAKGHAKLPLLGYGVIQKCGEYGVRRQRQRPLLDDEPAIAVSPPDIGFYVSP
jgi:hypothetical protein